VDDIHVGEDGRMKAHVKIRGDFAPFVRSDSRATIKKVFGVAGDSFLEISQGRGVPLEKDSVVECLSSDELPGMMEKMLADLRADVMPVVKKAGVTFDSWSTLGNELKTTQAELRQAIGQLNQLFAGVQEGKGTAGQLLQETALMDEARKLLAQAGGAVSQLQALLTNAQVAVTNVQVSTVRLPEITDALANEAKDLPGLVLQTQGTMRELERLVEGIQRHWLIRKYVNKTNPPPLHPLPAEEFSQPTPIKPLRSPRDAANKP
jgi:phospholipid/cholesterol/gamma-HCH transport system substrate-binding protein